MKLASSYLNGESPRARGEKKLRRCLDWLYRWGYSSGPVLTTVSQAKQAIAGKMVKAGLVVATRTEAGGVTRGTPAFYYTLTQSGLEEAERMTEQLVRYPEADDRYRVNQGQLRHYLLAQSATAIAINAGAIIKYQTERQIDGEGDKVGIKRPDVVWTYPSGKQMAVEVELSAKWERKLDDFVLAIYRCLEPGETGSSRFERVTVITDSPAIKTRYEEAVQPNKPIQIWEKNKRGHYAVTETILAPEWLVERVDFSVIES
jgi:hypothetical protein